MEESAQGAAQKYGIKLVVVKHEQTFSQPPP